MTAETVAEEVTFTTCPRCGNEHDDADNVHDDHCCDCEDWIKCDKCGSWDEPGDTTAVGSETWCESCTKNHSATCENCSAIVPDDETNTVVSRNGDEQEWCESCLHNQTFHCDSCGQDFDRHRHEQHYHGNSTYCTDCREENFFYCEICDEYHRNDDGCPNHCEHIASYGKHGYFKVKNDRALSMMPVFGAEMEVGDFASTSDRNDAADEFMDNLGHTFAYPTSDSSLGDNGVEFITHPVGTIDWLFDDRLEMFMDIMREHNADCSSGTNAGCHLTTDKGAFAGSEAIKAMVAVISRFRNVLLLAGDDNSRGSYCTTLEEDEDPIEGAHRIGKYSCVNLKGRLVEVRVPGMMLCRDRFVAQLQMYANAIDWCNRVTSYKESGTASFDDVFLPVLHQSTLSEVIKVGRSTAPINYTEVFGFLRIDTFVPLDLQGSILGVPVIVIGPTQHRDVDHDSYRHVGGNTVEVGDIIEFGGIAGIAISPASGFSGTIMRCREHYSSSNRVFGYVFYSNMTRNSLTLQFKSDSLGGPAAVFLPRLPKIEFVDCERLPEVVADKVNSLVPVYERVSYRVYVYDTSLIATSGAFVEAKKGQFGVELHTGIVMLNTGAYNVDKLYVPTKEYSSNYCVVKKIYSVAGDGSLVNGFQVTVKYDISEVVSFFPTPEGN